MRHLTALLALILALPALAHDGVTHKNTGEAQAHQAFAGLGPVTDLPFDLGGDFTLTDQTGATRTQASPDGRAQLVFFGYANCPAICSVAMPLMAEITDAVQDAGHGLQPVMITVDPKRDTVANMGPALARLHPDFVGLTGTKAQLDHVYGLFKVSHEKMFDDPDYGAVFSHGSHIYLLDAKGEVLTLFPPILGASRARDIVLKYLGS
jgi:protein SCO1/2